MQRSVGIIGTGAYVPERVLTNAALAESLKVDEDWIVRKTGIRERRIAAAHEATSDLATRAAERALAAANISAGDLNLIIVATSSPDRIQPATACLVQANLGAKGAAAFDLGAVCSGFVYALNVAHAAMCGNPAFRTALVVGAETYSRILDYQDPKTCILFGDGAGAVVLGDVPAGYGILAGTLGADGTKANLVQIPAGGSRQPISATTLAARDHFFQMDGRGVREFLDAYFLSTVASTLDSAGLALNDLDLLIPHQANGAILETYREALGLPAGKVHYTFEHYGNTAAASVPITLDDAVRSEHLQPNANVLLVAFGGGMTWSSTLLRWAPATMRRLQPKSSSHMLIRQGDKVTR